MTETQDISDKVIDADRRPIATVEQLQQALVNLEKWYQEKMAAYDRQERAGYDNVIINAR